MNIHCHELHGPRLTAHFYLHNISFYHFLFFIVSFTVVAGLRFSVPLGTNLPVFASRTLKLLFLLILKLLLKQLKKGTSTTAERLYTKFNS